MRNLEIKLVIILDSSWILDGIVSWELISKAHRILWDMIAKFYLNIGEKTVRNQGDVVAPGSQ